MNFFQHPDPEVSFIWASEEQLGCVILCFDYFPDLESENEEQPEVEKTPKWAVICSSKGKKIKEQTFHLYNEGNTASHAKVMFEREHPLLKVIEIKKYTPLTGE